MGELERGCVVAMRWLVGGLRKGGGQDCALSCEATSSLRTSAHRQWCQQYMVRRCGSGKPSIKMFLAVVCWFVFVFIHFTNALVLTTQVHTCFHF